jgi:hypothetical protein
LQTPDQKKKTTKKKNKKNKTTKKQNKKNKTTKNNYTARETFIIDLKKVWLTSVYYCFVTLFIQ